MLPPSAIIQKGGFSMTCLLYTSILVMKDGKIIEQGNHESLLAADGFYANLYNSQFA